MPLARDGEGEIRNQALASWAWESKGGASQFVMNLRDGLTFHDGSAVEAEDVVGSIFEAAPPI